MAITVRASEEQLEEIEALKTSIEEKTSSGALLAASREYPKMKRELQKTRQRISELERQIRTLKGGIENYAEARQNMFALLDE